jgi:DNA-binding NtrC family response regulator
MSDLQEKKTSILYVDDDQLNINTFKINFRHNYNLFTALSGEEALDILENSKIKVIISDQRMPGLTGVELLQIVRNKYPNVIRMILTAFNDIDIITEAINKANVFGFSFKPMRKNEIKSMIDNAIEVYNLRENQNILLDDLKTKKEELEKNNSTLKNEIEYREKIEDELNITLKELNNLKGKLEDENKYLKEEIKTNHNFKNIITKNTKFQNLLRLVEQVAPTSSTALLLGETGTGKELIARAIHDLSSRANNAFIKINCASLQENLIESELFGHEKGAFTGALAMKKGRFEIADKGSIFLDEIGELPPTVQSKLLRVLQEGEFERLGSTTTIKVDVRIIAATNRELDVMIKDGKFREDLYYRLNVFPVNVIPLRDRKDDIPILINHFLSIYSTKIGKKIETITDDTMRNLIDYSWPGNVRELENVIERAVILSKDKTIKIKTLEDISKQSNKPTLEVNINDSEKKKLITVLEKFNWNVEGKNGVANYLGIPASTIRYKMKKHGITRPSRINIDH